MDIKSPKVFETSDKAHADLFNDMVKVLLENDSGLLDQIIGHIDDTNPHASAAEKDKWNESQLYKITADDGKYLISVPTDKNIYDAIKDKGTCTFIASPGVEDSPAPSNAYLRGIQTVGQNNIGTGFAVDTSGNAYYFYYNSSHISITWTQLPTVAERNKWNNGQLSKITADNGVPLIYVRDVNESILDKIIDSGLGMGTFYAVTNSKDLPPASRSIRGIYHMTDSSNGKGTFGWVYAIDFANMTYHNYLNNGSWRGWQRVLTDDELSSTWNLVTLINGTAQHNSVYPLKFSIRQNTLHLRGSFENIPPNETVIARFAQKPSGNATFIGATVGSYGSARLSLSEDGSLKFDGLSANDPSKVNRIEINELIPLW